MKVERIGADRAVEWDAYVFAHPESTVYHRYAWRAIFGESFGYRSFYVIVRNDGGAIEGCLPLFIVRGAFSKRLVAVPFRDRGALLWSSDDAFRALVREAQAIAAECGAASIEFKSIHDYPPQLVQETALHEHRYWVRSSVDLRPLDKEVFWKKVGAKTRNMIRQAEEASLVLRDFTFDEKGPSIWYALYLDTQSRMGLPPFPLAFFRRMLRELRDSGAAKLFVVLRDEQPLAATIVLLHRRTAIYGYSASAKAGQAHRPNDFMLYSVMTRLIDEHYEDFDLGSDAPAQESLLFFKRKWLAAQSAIPMYIHGTADFAISDSSHPRYRALRRMFTYLPKPVLRAIGSGTTRFFG